MNRCRLEIGIAHAHIAVDRKTHVKSICHICMVGGVGVERNLDGSDYVPRESGWVSIYVDANLPDQMHDSNEARKRDREMLRERC